MGVSYKKLWKILIDRDMKKKDLMEAAGLSPSTISKLFGNEFVTLHVIAKICAALDVGINEVLEFTKQM